MRSGARQWRHDCECKPQWAEERHSQPWERMHSEVSKANAGYFIEEDRLRKDHITEGQLRKMVDNTSGSIIVCNVCGRLKEVDTDDTADTTEEQYRQQGFDRV